MSACDRRSYYPTQNGLFKLRASDGDLVWEARPVSYNIATVASFNSHVDKTGNRIIASGFGVGSGGTFVNSAVFVEDSGSEVPNVELISGTEVVVDISGVSPVTMYDRTDDYVYLVGGRSVGGFGRWNVASRFDASTRSLIDATTVVTLGELSGFRAVQGTDRFDLIRLNTPLAGSIARFVSGNPTAIASLDWTTGPGAPFGPPYFFSFDRNFRLPSDGTHYYVNRSGGPEKIAIATLTRVATVSGLATFTMLNTRDGYLSCAAGSAGSVSRHAVLLTAGMTTAWSSNVTFGNTHCGDVCANFSVFTGTLPGFTSTLTSTQFKVVKFDHGGNQLWSKTLLYSDDRSAYWQLRPTPVISRDESRIYVYGPMSHNGLGFNALKLSLYCLDADDGSIVWSFAAGDGGAGMSLLEDGDYLYLSVKACSAPLYR